jgi:hypothetical protein
MGTGTCPSRKQRYALAAAERQAAIEGRLNTDLEAAIAGMNPQQQVAVRGSVHGANMDWRDDNDQDNIDMVPAHSTTDVQRVHPVVTSELQGEGSIVFTQTLLGGTNPKVTVGRPIVLAR